MARYLLFLLLLGIAGAAGFWAFRTLMASHVPPAQPAPAAATAKAPDVEPGAAAPRRIPEALPDVSLPDREGRPRKLSEWADRPLLINFWATWCAPCRREIPLLKRLRTERREQGLEVIGIAVDVRESVLAYANDIGLDYPLLIGEQEGFDAAAAFGMDLVLPFSVFSDRSGRIVTLKVGELHADEADFILDTVRDLDAGRVDLPGARQRIAERLRTLAADRANAGI
jgi:thiol-disulfide isomerase/thioredoxin